MMEGARILVIVAHLEDLPIEAARPFDGGILIRLAGSDRDLILDYRPSTVGWWKSQVPKVLPAGKAIVTIRYQNKEDPTDTRIDQLLLYGCDAVPAASIAVVEKQLYSALEIVSTKPPAKRRSIASASISRA